MSQGLRVRFPRLQRMLRTVTIVSRTFTVYYHVLDEKTVRVGTGTLTPNRYLVASNRGLRRRDAGSYALSAT